MSAFSLNAHDCTSEGGIVGDNHFKISEDDKSKSTITRQQFNAVIKRIKTYYTPIIKARGAFFKISGSWSDDTVNAGAIREGRYWRVKIFGGIARHPLMTLDGLLLVGCHEVGHHMGGAPRYLMNSDWASNEGQSDYWASLKCMRNLLKDEDHTKILSTIEVDPLVEANCSMVYPNLNEKNLCIRISYASLSLARVLGSLRGNTNIHFNTPDPQIVIKTYDHHPIGQCRLDTYFQGALCDRPMTEEVSRNDPTIGTCHVGSGHQLGLRPRCWYVPESSEI